MSSSVVTRLEQLAVEQSDTFFYDHPLDHVPGMVLFDGLLRAARDAHAGSTGDVGPARIRASLDFTRICESNQPTTLSCAPADGCGGWSVSALQGGREVSSGVFEFVAEEVLAAAQGPEIVAVPARTGAASTGSGGIGTGGAASAAFGRGASVSVSSASARVASVRGDFAALGAPAPAQLVHRSRPENILVGEVTRPPIESLLLSPPDGHVLRRADPGFHSATELVEAGRQFIVMLAHTEGGAAMDTQMLWLSLTIDIPARVPRHAPTLLRCLEHSGTDQRMVCTVLLVDAVTGAELGMLNYVTLNVDPARYAKLRARG